MGITSFFSILIVFLLQISTCFSQELIEVKRLDSISVFFKSGSFEVENPQKLTSRLSLIKASQGKVRIISYTDTVGSLSANQKLAAKRINAVSKLVRTTNLKTFIFDSVNKNELRTGRKLTDSSFRRVDVIVYNIENKFGYDKPINLNINFESGKDIIVLSSTENLKTLLSILQKDSTLRVQLNGHVCCRPAHELSVSRAESVKKYLVSNGISRTRIYCKGYSNSVPLYSDNNMENQRKNMRVEVIFIKPKTN
jgi:outer membrane protein OmpA-like peptidoglycan-associated protein